jgi:nitrogen regulatory protein PII
MVYIEINKTNYKVGNPTHIDFVNKQLEKKPTQAFILFYMEGCGPCNATRPEWHKMKNVLSKEFLNRDDIIIVAIDKDLGDKLKHVKSQPSGFPTMRYMTESGDIVETYEDSSVSNKDRTIDSFVEWVKIKTGEDSITKSDVDSNIDKHSISHSKRHKTKRGQRGGKWSRKYKRSINCRRPKGFSQKQYCKYGRNTYKRGKNTYKRG